MKASDVLHLIAGGETSHVQFKQDVTNATSIAQEMVAFANTKGGKMIIGVNDKTGMVEGLADWGKMGIRCWRVRCFLPKTPKKPLPDFS